MQKFLIYLIVAIACGSTFATYIYTPSFPALAQAFQTSNTQIQFTMTSFLLAFSVFQMLYGPLSDRYGRKNMIIAGTLICIVGTLICALTASFSIFMVGRFLQGAGAAASLGLVRTIARDLFNGDELSQVFSIMGILFAISFAIAPTLGGYLQDAWGWRSTFIFVFAYMGLMLLCALFYLPETLKNPNPKATQIKTIAENLKILFSSRVFMGYALCYGVTWSALVAYSAMSPFLFQNILHLSPTVFGYLGIAVTAGLIASSLINTRLVIKKGRQYMMNVGLGIMSLASILMFVIGMLGFLNVAAVITPIFFFIMGIGIVSANAGASALSPFGHIAGIAGALYGTIQMFIPFMVSAIVAHLHNNTQQPLAATLIILSIIAAGFYFFMASKE